MGKKETFSPPVVGGSSLLVIFAVLCLTIFALLALSGAQANERLADAAVQSVSDYYQADCQAEQILAQLRQGDRPQGVQEQDGIYTYSCPISDTQALEIAVELDGSSYHILRWQAVSTAEWQPDDDLAVWDGE